MGGFKTESAANVLADIANLPADEQETALEVACRGDPDLREELHQLLSSNQEAEGYFEDLRARLPMIRMSEEQDFRRRDPYGLVGKTVLHFRVEEHLGGGGMGVVYRARDVHIPRNVVLKLLPPEMRGSDSAVARFKHEVITAASLEHQNIAVVYEVGRLDSGQLFFAMAYYDGETIKKKIERGPLPLQHVIDYGIAIAAGLSEAHKHGIIHRDVKPANIMVTNDQHVKLLDFGIAKFSDMTTLTQTGSVPGTLAYMSPEQLRGGEVDARSDIWSTSLVLYEMLTGVQPFQADYHQAIIYKVLNVDPPGIRHYRDDVPAELAELVQQCLDKEATKRIATMDELGEKLVAASRIVASDGEHGSSEGEALPRRSVISVSRKTKLAFAAGVLLAVVAVLFAIKLNRFGDRVDIAVLPFTNIGADSMLVSGLMYAVSNNIVRLEGMEGRLSVVPLSDVLDHQINSSSAAAELFGVDYVLGGDVQAASDGISMNVNLVDAPEGRIVANQYLEVPNAEKSRLQKDVVSALSELLNIGDDVREDLEAGSTQYSGAYDRYTRARGYLLGNENETNVDAAINLLVAAVSEDKEYALAYAALGEAYLHKYRLTRDSRFIDEAIASGTQARALNADLAPVRIALGLTYFESGDYEKSELELLRAHTLEPNSAEVNHRLGMVYYSRNVPAKSENFYKQAIALKPNRWRYHNDLGQLYHYEGRHEDAAEAFREVIRLHPDGPWGYNNLGVQMQRLGRPEAALEQYRLAIEVDPEIKGAVTFAHNNIARLHYTERDYRSAAEWFELATHIDKLNYESWDQLGNAYYMTGRPAESRDSWMRVVEITSARLEINPNDREALNYAAEAYAKLGMADLALSNLYALLSQERVEPEDYVVIGKVHEILGRRDSSLYYIGKGLEAGASVESVEVSIWLDELREDPAYQTLAARL